MAKEIVAKTAFAECDAGLGELAGDKKMNLAGRFAVAKVWLLPV